MSLELETDFTTILKHNPLYSQIQENKSEFNLKQSKDEEKAKSI